MHKNSRRWAFQNLLRFLAFFFFWYIAKNKKKFILKPKYNWKFWYFSYSKSKSLNKWYLIIYAKFIYAFKNISWNSLRFKRSLHWFDGKTKRSFGSSRWKWRGSRRVVWWCWNHLHIWVNERNFNFLDKHWHLING